MKEYNHIGAYGILIENDKILLIKKANGPYAGKLDLPGGTIEIGEKPEYTLKREFLEESGIEIKDYKIFDADSVEVIWSKNNELVKMHHMGIFYKINSYLNEVKKKINITDINDDSLGANFYEIDKLEIAKLSNIALLELKKLGYFSK